MYLSSLLSAVLYLKKYACDNISPILLTPPTTGHSAIGAGLYELSSRPNAGTGRSLLSSVRCPADLNDAAKTPKEIICKNHYTKSWPSGKSHVFQFEEAIVVFSIPANYMVCRWLGCEKGKAWEALFAAHSFLIQGLPSG